MAMVYQALTGKEDQSPYDMGQLAQEWGYMAETAGTPYTFCYAVADHFGFDAEQLDYTADAIRTALRDGAVVVGNMGNGYFSSGDGHYIVLTGVTDDGKITINDPYSPVNSAKTWEADFLIEEAKGFHAFKK